MGRQKNYVKLHEFEAKVRRLEIGSNNDLCVEKIPRMMNAYVNILESTTAVVPRKWPARKLTKPLFGLIHKSSQNGEFHFHKHCQQIKWGKNGII